MSQHKQLPLTRSRREIIANGIGITIFLVTCIYLFMVYGNLPDHVPMSIDAEGNAGRMGEKLEILYIPFGAVLFWVAFNFVERQAHWHVYPERMTDNNREAFYRNSIHMMNLIKNAMLIVISILLLDTISHAQGDGGMINTQLFMLVIFVLMGAPIAYSLFERRKIS